MLFSRRLRAVAQKEIKEIVRDKLYLSLAFGVPLLLYLLFGFGLTLDADNIPFAVIDQNRSPQSRALVDRLVNSKYFTIKHSLDDYRPLQEGLLDGHIRLGLIIPPNFDRALFSGQPSEIQALIDGAFPDRAAAILSYLDIITREFNHDLALPGYRPAGPVIQVEGRAWFNPDLASKNFIVPGLIATNLFFYPALLASIAVVREKESGSIFNIYCSPIRPWEYLLGKLLPYWGIGFLNFFLLALLAHYVYHIPFRGSFLFLTLATLLYVGVTTSLGLLMSILFKTQVAAMLITTVITLIPAFIYSGFFISVPSMGSEAQVMAHLLPVTYYMEIVRGAYLKGLGVSQYWPNLLILLGFFAAFFGLGLRRLKKRVG
ncbi:MAG: ABC transporter permease [Deltaproteobacteria bacterium]|nr:ABC transporter permease [Deltaproteobacteria bacterium]